MRLLWLNVNEVLWNVIVVCWFNVWVKYSVHLYRFRLKCLFNRCPIYGMIKFLYCYVYIDFYKLADFLLWYSFVNQLSKKTVMLWRFLFTANMRTVNIKFCFNFSNWDSEIVVVILGGSTCSVASQCYHGKCLNYTYSQ